MKRRRSSTSVPREKRTLIPAFAPEELVGDQSYELIVQRRVSSAIQELPRSMAVTAAPPQKKTDDVIALEEDDTLNIKDTEAMGRQMYGSYLASDFPEALVLAERVLAQDPEHQLAQMVADRCRARLSSRTRSLSPSSVLRLKLVELERQAKHIDGATSCVLGHVDGVTDAQTVCALSGLPEAQALDRLHALLDLGIVELVSNS